jgi:autophagy-related protein 16
LKLTKELSELKDQNTGHTATIANLKQENERAEKGIQHLMNEVAEAASRAELAEKQYDGLKLTIRSLQKENDDIQKENRQLETRMVADKSKLVSEMNNLTDLVESLKRERDMLRSYQKQETKKTPQETKKTSWFGSGFSSTASAPKASEGSHQSTPLEEDPSRKFGDLKIVLPTAVKLAVAAHSQEGVCVRYDSGSSVGGTNLVVTAGSDATVKVWDTSNGLLKTTFRGSSGQPFLGCDISGHFVAGGGSDKTCRVWSLKTDRMVSDFLSTLHAKNCSSLCTRSSNAEWFLRCTTW